MYVKSDLAVITCHFNWFNYNRPKYNLNRFLRRMKAMNIPVYGAETSLDGKFVTEGNSNWLHLKAEDCNICWQKEALLNAAETIVPKQYTKIAWIDHDIYFDNIKWYDEASKALDEYNLVQLYENCYWSDINSNLERHAYSLLSVKNLTIEHTLHKKMSWWVDKDLNIIEIDQPLNKIPDPPVLKVTDEELNRTKVNEQGIILKQDFRLVYHSGFALAANRSLWKENIKLYPYYLLGGGDRALMNAIFNEPISIYPDRKLPDDALSWRSNFSRYVNFKTGSIKGGIYHEYHGARKNRGYNTRHSFMNKYKFNFKDNLTVHNHLLTIKDAPQFLEAIKQYFKDRNEDT